MLCHLQQLTHEVVLRSRANWLPDLIPAHSPIITDTLSLIELCHYQQFIWQKQIISNQTSVGETQQRLCHLLVLKQEMDELRWPSPTQLPAASRQWYTHDLMVSLGLSYILQTGIQLLKGYCDEKELPSHTIISSYTIQTALQNIPGLSQFYPNYTWIHQTLENTPPLLTEIMLLQQKMEQSHLSDPFRPITLQSLQHLIHHLPRYLPGEQFYYDLFRQVNSLEKTPRRAHSFHRRLVLLNLTLFIPDTELLIQLYKHYKALLMEQIHTFEEWDTEHQYWQMQHLLHKDTMPEALANKQTCLHWMVKLIQFCQKKAEEASPGSVAAFIPIDWKNTPQAFVRLFHPLRLSQTITLNGNNDIEPLCKKLHQMFRIPKVKGDGYLTLASLVTYFKNMNSDDY
ncbi:MAG: hypothetical protein JEZ14_04720 [Marinilabiliaceae bacterium]|nr:hypothetical protein [Marinilabiliaceae bacterium]